MSSVPGKHYTSPLSLSLSLSLSPSPSLLRQESQYLVSMCASLLGLYISLIISSLARHFESRDPPNGPNGCAFFSAVLEYFSQAFLCWLVAETTVVAVSYGSYYQFKNKHFVIISLVCWCES